MRLWRHIANVPYALLGALSVVCFGGPFVILVVVRGGASTGWPPDRPIEWITIAVVFGLFFALFFACVTLSWWHAPSRSGGRRRSQSR
jgi:hypothetical protein